MNAFYTSYSAETDEADRAGLSVCTNSGIASGAFVTGERAPRSFACSFGEMHVLTFPLPLFSPRSRFPSLPPPSYSAIHLTLTDGKSSGICIETRRQLRATLRQGLFSYGDSLTFGRWPSKCSTTDATTTLHSRLTVVSHPVPLVWSLSSRGRCSTCLPMRRIRVYSSDRATY